MSKVAVVYYSGTGNTQAMAEAVAEGVRKNNGEADVFDVYAFDASVLTSYDAFAFGCPAMGVEVLEEGVFEPMFAGIESSLGGKKVGLFGSYGWGDGTWMRNWQERVLSDGATLVSDGVIANGAPGGEEIALCEELGAALSR